MGRRLRRLSPRLPAVCPWHPSGRCSPVRGGCPWKALRPGDAPGAPARRPGPCPPRCSAARRGVPAPSARAEPAPGSPSPPPPPLGGRAPQKQRRAGPRRTRAQAGRPEPAGVPAAAAAVTEISAAMVPASPAPAPGGSLRPCLRPSSAARAPAFCRESSQVAASPRGGLERPGNRPLPLSTLKRCASPP